MSESNKDDFQESAAENKKQLEIFSGAREEENLTPPVVPKPTEPPGATKEKGIHPNEDTKFSIFAGIAQDDSFIFKMMGTDQSYTNLIGLTDFISARVQQEKDKKLQTGDAITIALFQGIQQLNAKLDALLSNLDRPSNKL